MKIINKTKNSKTVPGRSIKVGECFLYKGRLYLAAQIGVDAPGIDCKNGKYLYRYDLQVTPVTATVTYEVK